MTEVERKANLFKELLQHEAIIEIRNGGLLMGIQVSSYDFVLKVIKDCLKNGLITDWFLFNSEAIREAPPLTITEAEIRKACQILLNAIDKAHKDGL